MFGKRISRVQSFSPMLGRKKGWIRIVEAFTAILLVTGILLIIFNKDVNEEELPSKRIFEQEQGILRYIELNNSLREEILSFNINELPISFENFPNNLKNAINEKTPSYLSCDAKICNLGSVCSSDDEPASDVYVQRAIISSSLNSYSPRELKLFCRMR